MLNVTKIILCKTHLLCSLKSSPHASNFVGFFIVLQEFLRPKSQSSGLESKFAYGGKFVF